MAVKALSGRQDFHDPVGSVSAVRPYVMPGAQGGHTLCLQVEGVHCAGCIQKIESALRAEPGVNSARLNFSTRRLVVGWTGPAAEADRLTAIVGGLGYDVRPYDTQQATQGDDEKARALLLALGVAGFAAGNIMLVSFALWTTDAATMGVATRDFLHWLSALIAIPAIAFAGRPFFSSAFEALRRGRTNMDVPISVGLLLTTGMSLFELATHGVHAYFDSAVMLMFFLLVGRYLDMRARASARRAARDLLSVMAGTATILTGDGARSLLIREIGPGMVLLTGMGERIAADGTVIAGESDIDASLVTGETVPVPAGPGDDVLSGGMNLSAPLQIRVARTPDDSQVGGMVRLMEKAEQSQARYRRLSDRVAGFYTPVVHVLALLAFMGWVSMGGLPWQQALLIAATVLIITCPCALALAVPVVQVLAVGVLMRRGIMVRSGDVLERLATVDTVIFDKTGTLTRGQPGLVNGEDIPPAAFAVAAAMAAHSRHPLSRALSQAWSGPLPVVEGVEEVPGKGLRAFMGGVEYRMGRHDWVTAAPLSPHNNALEIVFAARGAPPCTFLFRDELRNDVPSVIAALQARGLSVRLLSGDRSAIVAATAHAAGIHDFAGDMNPADKFAVLEELQASGRRVLMVGDGINDAPVLAGAHVSVSPSSAADIASNAAGAVFTGEKLQPVVTLVDTARKAQVLVRQNLAMTVVYNILAVPLAMAGYVTPLVAAAAMSGSSLAVTLNAFRLRRVA